MALGIGLIVGLIAAAWYVYFRRATLMYQARGHGPLIFLPGPIAQFVVFGGITWLIAYLIGL